MNKLIKSSAVIIGALALLQATAHGAAGNASVSVKIDKLSRLFVLNINDARGIKSFSFQPTGADKLPYSGDLNGCPKNRTQDNVVFSAPADFTPFMKAVIADCAGGETEFEIYAPNENGVSKVVKVDKSAPPPATPAPTPVPAAPSAAPAPTPTGAEPLSRVTYPIPELGNCAGEKACKTYCENSANMERCVAFAKDHNLLPQEEIAKGEKFIKIVKEGGGPGGCKSQQSCEAYCNDVGKIDECIAFAEKEGFMDQKELDEAKKIKSALNRGQKMPGDCRNKKACEAYCQSPEHIDECFAFAKESGFMSEEELKQAEKFIPLMKAGKSPGGCKTKETCEAFCEADEHLDECIAFADEAGLLSAEEKEIIKKTGGKGPGGCKGRACATFCENPANQEVCFAFAKENGLISEDDLKRAEEGMKFMRESMQNASPEVKECVEKIIGAPGLAGGSPRFGSGEAGEPGKGLAFSGPEIGEKMRECFQNIIPEGARGKFEFGSGGEFQGPGGCKSKEECEAYCKNDPKACGFEMPEGGGSPGEGRFPGSGSPSGRSGGSGVGAPTGCSFMDLNPVCAKIKDSESSNIINTVTFNNECFAKNHEGRGVLLGITAGTCPGHKSCDPVPPSVCGIKGNVIQSYFNKCVLENDTVPYAAKILHEGECTKEDTSSGDRGGEECVKQGGSWDGKTCNFSNLQQPQQYQQQYQQQYLEEFKKQCESQGGVWDGAKCAAPSLQQPPTGFTPGSAYDALLRLIK